MLQAFNQQQPETYKALQMKQLLLLTILCLSTLTLATAQITRGGGGAFTIGTQLLPTSELLQFDPSAPELSTSNISIGGYSFFQFNSFVVGMSGSGFYGSEKTDSRNTYERGGGMFTVDFGYKVVNSPSFSLYPLIGLGAGGFGYSISGLDDVVIGGDTPAPNESSYNYSSFLFDIGLRFEKTLGYEEGDCGKGAGMVGVELGYLMSPSSNEWKTGSGASVINGPEYSMSGFYVRLLIGGFGGF